MIAYEPKFDDPSRTACYGFFAHERLAAPVITGDDLANAIESGVAPRYAPFREWAPQLLVGCQLDNARCDFSV